jgi:hypothetical protein
MMVCFKFFSSIEYVFKTLEKNEQFCECRKDRFVVFS